MSADRPVVRCAADRETPFLHYLLELLGTFLEIDFALEKPTETDHAEVYFGLREGSDASIRVPAVPAYSLATVPGVPQDELYGIAADPEAPFPFDLVAATRFWITDEGNGPERMDEHGRLPPRHSAQEQRGLREIPIVNAYFLLFAHWLERRLGVRAPFALPRGKRCAVVLSHDVDSPFNPSDPRHALQLAFTNVHRRQDVARSTLYAAHALARAGAARVQTPGSRHWLFHEVVRAERKHGFTSTFFFAATSRFDPQGYRHDVAYDVARQPFPRLLAELGQLGVGVGLHLGYWCLDDVAQIASERERLEHAAGFPILGGRHHYWHLSTPLWGSLNAHAAAGLVFDSSIGFNEAPGYRLGIAAAFRPWDPLRYERIASLQVPTVAMDSMFFRTTESGKPGRKTTATIESTLANVSAMLATLKRYRGTAALDWHEYTSFPARQEREFWGRAYLEILELLAHDDDVAVVSYNDLLSARPS